MLYIFSNKNYTTLSCSYVCFKKCHSFLLNNKKYVKTEWSDYQIWWMYIFRDFLKNIWQYVRFWDQNLFRNLCAPKNGKLSHKAKFN